MKRFVKASILAGLLALGGQASAIILPGVNNMTVGQYGDFYVYSLDLLEQCSQDPSPNPALTCQPFLGDGAGGRRVASGAGRIADNIVVYADASGGQLNNEPTPFANAAFAQVDNNFQPPTGNNTLDFNMTAANEPDEDGIPAPSFVGDVEGKWDAKLSSIVDFLGGADLVFFFDNNQVGTDLNQQQYFYAEVSILNGPAGGVVQKYCLNNTHTFGVFNPIPGACGAFQDVTYTTVGNDTFVNPEVPGDAGSFVGSGGRFCVSKATGEGYIPPGGVPGNDGDCNGDYFVSNNLGASYAEFAAFVPHLNNNLQAWADAGYFMQIDFKMRGLNDGGEKLWIAKGNERPPVIVPEPGSVALVALGLLGIGAASRRRRQA